MAGRCPECPFTTESVRKLKRHAVVAHAKITYKCPLCPFISTYQSNIYHHKRNIHGIARNYNCDYCQLFVRDAEELLRHKQTEHAEEYGKETAHAHERYMKEIKELSQEHEVPTPPLPRRLKSNNKMPRFKAAKNKKNAKVDVNGVDDDGDDIESRLLKPCRIQRTYVCDHCDMTTRNPRDFLYHNRDVHGEKLNVFECTQCVYASRHFQKLQRHIGFVHAIAKVRNPRILPPRQPVARKSMSHHLEEYDDDDDDDNHSEFMELDGFDDDSQDYHYPESMSNEGQDEEILEIIDGEVDEVMNLSQVDSNAMDAKELSPASEGEFKCSSCHFKSKSKLVVKQHEKVAHLKKKFFRCSKCKYVTHIKGRLTKHSQLHNAGKLDCRLCDFSCTDQATMDDHLVDHSTKSVFKCSLCKFDSRSRSEMADHLVSCHKDLKVKPTKSRRTAPLSAEAEDVSVSVDPANILFEDAERSTRPKRGRAKKTNSKAKNSTSYSLNRYSPEFYLKCGKWYRRKLKCQFCAFRTASSAELHDHEEHHYQENGEAACPLCRQRFDDIPQAKEHVQEKHGSALQFTEQQGTAKVQSAAAAVMTTPPPPSMPQSTPDKPLKCNFCPYEAKWMSEMLKHNRIHTQEKPFECQFCQFRSRWKGDMTRHIQKYHEALCRQRRQMGFADEDNYRIIDNSAHNGVSGAALLPIDAFTDESETSYAGKGSLGDGVQVLSQSDFQVPVVDGNLNGMPDLERYAVREEVKGKSKSPRKGNGRSPQLKKRYQCPRCDFSALTASRFHVHMVGHMNQRPFMCSECHYRSNWQWDITKHIRMKVARGENHTQATLVMLNECGLKNYEKYKPYVVYEERPKADDESKKNSRTKANSVGGSSTSSSGCFSEANQDLGIVRQFSWRCKMCDFKTSKKKEMIDHLPVHTNNGFFCGDCGRSSRSKSVVERHCRAVHGNVNVLENESRSVAYEAGNGDAHMDNGGYVEETVQYADEKTGSPSKEHSCSICPFKCKNVFDMRMHMRLHQPQPDAIFKCMFCPFYTSLRRSLLQHMKLHVSEPQEYISQAMENSCTKFSETTEIDVIGAYNKKATSERPNGINCQREEPPELEDATLHASTKTKRYNCDICPYTSNSKTQYLYHKQFHRNSKTYACKCPHCNYGVTRGHLLLQHIKLHEKAEAARRTKSGKPVVNSRAHPASVLRCGAEALTIHSNITTTTKKAGIPLVWVSKGTSMLKMYKCRFCPHVNKRRSNIREHEKMHRKRRLAGKFSCPYCTYTCSNQGVLSTHVKVHQNTSQTVEPFDDLAEARFEMPRDAASYSENVNVNIMRNDRPPQLVVEETKPSKMYYFCDLCPARFSRPCDVVAHKKFHDAGLLWKCRNCNYTARHRPHLHRHLKVHTMDYQRKTNELMQVADPYAAAADVVIDPVPPFETAKKSKNAYKYEKRHQCHTCPAAFLKPSSLAHHLSLHGGKGKFKCHHCDYAVRNVGNLVRHMKIHGTLNRKPEYVVPPMSLDGEPSSSDASLSATTSPRKEGKRFDCPKCPAFFHKWTRFDVHYRLHGCQQRFTCHSCDYSVKFMANLIKHQKIHDNNVDLHDAYPDPPDAEMPVLTSAVADDDLVDGQGNVALRSISKQFGELSQAEQQMVMLLQHQHQMAQQQHLGEDSRRLFFCDRCPYNHARKDAVLSHLRRHYTGRDMRCPYCDYSTTLPSFLRNHSKLHFQQRKIHRVDGYLKWDQMDVVAVLPGGVTSRIFKDDGEETVEEAAYDEQEPEMVTIDATPSTMLENGFEYDKEFRGEEEVVVVEPEILNDDDVVRDERNDERLFADEGDVENKETTTSCDWEKVDDVSEKPIDNVDDVTNVDDRNEDVCEDLTTSGKNVDSSPEISVLNDETPANDIPKSPYDEVEEEELESSADFIAEIAEEVVVQTSDTTPDVNDDVCVVGPMDNDNECNNNDDECNNNADKKHA